jgi:hypothetical protein
MPNPRIAELLALKQELDQQRNFLFNLSSELYRAFMISPKYIALANNLRKTNAKYLSDCAADPLNYEIEKLFEMRESTYSNAELFLEISRRIKALKAKIKDRPSYLAFDEARAAFYRYLEGSPTKIVDHWIEVFDQKISLINEEIFSLSE